MYIRAVMYNKGHHDQELYGSVSNIGHKSYKGDSPHSGRSGISSDSTAAQRMTVREFLSVGFSDNTSHR